MTDQELADAIVKHPAFDGFQHQGYIYTWARLGSQIVEFVDTHATPPSPEIEVGMRYTHRGIVWFDDWDERDVEVIGWNKSLGQWVVVSDCANLYHVEASQLGPFTDSEQPGS